MIIATLLLLLQLKVPDAAQFVGEPKGTPVTGVQLDRRTNEVASLLRCPVCQGMAVADSKAEMAVNMKGQVRELLERGYTEQQILKYFELSYGQFVLLEPKFEGVNTLVWLLPVGALLIGAVVVFFVFRRLRRPSAQPAAEQPGTPAATTDDPYLARVRDLVGKGQP
jgi:cytochrome c-type biogenesis protein CcmH